MYPKEFILGISPSENPDAELVKALCRANAVGVLDLGRDPRQAEKALKHLESELPGGFGVKVSALTMDAPLPRQVTLVVVPSPLKYRHLRAEGRRILVQVCSVSEALDAEAEGADGLIAKGSESGGRVGEETGFVLLQAIMRRAKLPVWAQGGIGLHTAAAAVVAGAKGIVLDSQLALLRESSLPEEIKRAVAAMDGGDTAVVGGYRVMSQPGFRPPLAESSPEEIERRLGASHPKDRLLPIGQDGAFAKNLAERFVSSAELVKGVHRAAAAQIRQVKKLKPLAPQSAWAKSHAVEYPIVQGPMSSVSDCPAFARAISDGGGVPFIALSAMSAEQARPLLQETQSLLAGRPWGVGLIGFAPQDLYQQQVSLLQEIRPRLALIAGGRPSQAIDLEKCGIETYLHVPSPGLLKLFIEEGARRFIFEGRECGGHVGPRSSFVLWESAIDQLLGAENLTEVSALFAGGIHDELSAAMVAASAAPLAARGARIGVLMGTAYLFTEEAVNTGAILPFFQQAAISCERTVLLETGPGHAVRAAPSDYVKQFQAERERLAAAGTDPQEMWAALESQNLGRLRIAAKAEKLVEGQMRRVDEESQQREGLFMLGQAAALRRERTTVAALHRQVSPGSTAYLEQFEPPETADAAVKPMDVAIIGIACVMPEAEDLEQFWSNILQGKSCIKEIPDTRWNKRLYYDPNGTGDKTPSKWGGFIPDILFEPAEFGIPPRSLASIEPAQLLSLLVAKRALKDAGIDESKMDRGRVSVVFGAEGGSELEAAYGFRMMYPQFYGPRSAELDEQLPSLTEDSFPGTLANVIAGRVANRLDLGGLNFTVNAACASSLAAVDVACKELLSGGSDLAIAGGADLHNSICDYLLFASVRALSPTGKCRPFDAKADGTVLGEGVGAVVLKRLEDARRDHDRIYAVIKAIGGSSDGRSLGLTAPNKEGQTKALLRAYERAGFSPAEVGLIEAHGTGTVVGDRAELASLTEFMLGAGALSGQCALGSVKAQIGHTKCNAGLAGLIKATLSVYHAVLPPTCGIESPNPYYDPNASPFAFYQQPRPWLSAVRRAGVSALGFGGTNFHAVLESAEGEPGSAALDTWPAELFLFRGSNRQQAEQRAAQLAAMLEGERRPALRDLAAGVAAQGDAAERVQIAMVAGSISDLRDKLQRVAQLKESRDGVYLAQPVESPGKIAFLFPGQGSQRPGMLSELFVMFPRLRPWLEQGKRFAPFLLSRAAYSPEERAAQKEAMSRTEVAQPTLAIADLAMADVLGWLGIRPDMTGGHSYGELVALTYAKSIERDQLIALSVVRAQAILESAGQVSGAMAAVLAAPEAVEKRLENLSGVVIANRNAPQQTVISGAKSDLTAAMEKLRAEGISCQLIPVSCAFHSPMMAKGAELFAGHLAGASIRAPQSEVFSNVTAQAYPPDPEFIRLNLSRQIVSTVRFDEQVRAMYRAGARVFIEVGPSDVLTGLVSRILKGQPHTALVTDQPALGSLRSLLEVAARLAALGAPVNPAALFESRRTRSLDETTPAKPPSPTAWIVDGQRARPARGPMPAAGLKPILEPLRAAPQLGARPEDAEREAAVAEFFRSMREVNQNVGRMIEGQLQVIMSYLGDSAKARALAQSALAPLAGLQNKSALPAEITTAVGVEAPAEPAGAERPMEVLITVLSERTGYPAEMLDPDLDLEADLGIDSIKRAEILGLLRQRLGLKADRISAETVEELARLKTLRGISEWLEAHLAQLQGKEAPFAARLEPPPLEKPPSPEEDRPPSPGVEPMRVDEGAAAEALQRLVPELAVAEPVRRDDARVRGRVFAVTQDARGVARALVSLLESRGARGRLIARGEKLAQLDGLVHLDALNGAAVDPVKSLFELAQQALNRKAGWIVGVTALGGRLGLDSDGSAKLSGAGISGFLKSLSHEAPSTRVRIIDLSADEPAEKLAEQIYGELAADDDLPEIGYASGARYCLTLAERPLDKKTARLQPGPESVVLITGGARGITARVAAEMARRFRCKLHLAGRSPLPPGEENPLTAACPDAAAIRRVLAQHRHGERLALAEVEAQCSGILKAREIRAALAAIRAAGAEVEYHEADVRDAERIGRVIDGVYKKHGRLDGVIHAAGITEDRFLSDKTRESFDRVLDTKVKGALALLGKLRQDVSFVVFFSSIASIRGNRGQADYAAANDFLDKLALGVNPRLAKRVLSINWGPWDEVGMVSAELRRSYQRQAIGLISPDQGVAAFLDELIYGEQRQVILLAPPPEGARLPQAGGHSAVSRPPARPGNQLTAVDYRDASGKRKATYRREISLATLPELIDHSFYRQRPGWKEPADLGPVVPMSGLVELMMDAARRMAPERRVVGVEEVQALRWLTASTPVEVAITCDFDGDKTAAVEIEGYAAAQIKFDDDYPLVPERDAAPLRNERPAPLTAAELYRDRWLFHGPAYQGVKRFGPLADDGIRGEIETGGALGALLDNAGQLLGVWVILNTEVDRRNMPVRIDRITFYGPHPEPGVRVQCTGRVRNLEERSVLSDMFLSVNGRPWAEVQGWYSLRFSTDARLWQVALWPEKNLLSTPHERGFVVFEDQYRSAVDREYLAGRYLREAERLEAARQSPRRKRAWVNGRIAAKDALRRFLWDKGHGPMFPAEVWIQDDAKGAPVVLEPAGQELKVSIAHKEDVAAALAAQGRAVGIDVEAVEPRGSEWEGFAFSAEELRLVGGDDRGQWLTRMWAAKEAFSKARGTGLECLPGAIRISERQGERFSIEGSWISTVQHGEYIIAWTEL